jgi:hypothetical protein
MPPIEPPMTAAHRSMPSSSEKAAWAATWSRMVRCGNREPHSTASGPKDDGPVLPWQPPSMLGATTNQRSVSTARPGPTTPPHQPAVRWPWLAWPTTWLSPVSACSSSTALSRAGESSPQVS